MLKKRLSKLVVASTVLWVGIASSAACGSTPKEACPVAGCFSGATLASQPVPIASEASVTVKVCRNEVCLEGPVVLSASMELAGRIFRLRSETIGSLFVDVTFDRVEDKWQAGFTWIDPADMHDGDAYRMTVTSAEGSTSFSGTVPQYTLHEPYGHECGPSCFSGPVVL